MHWIQVNLLLQLGNFVREIMFLREKFSRIEFYFNSILHHKDRFKMFEIITYNHKNSIYDSRCNN